MDSKDFVKFDIAIVVITLVNYTLTQFKINENYSFDYKDIWLFYTLQTVA